MNVLLLLKVILEKFIDLGRKLSDAFMELVDAYKMVGNKDLCVPETRWYGKKRSAVYLSIYLLNFKEGNASLHINEELIDSFRVDIGVI